MGWSQSIRKQLMQALVRPTCSQMNLFSIEISKRKRNGEIRMSKSRQRERLFVPWSLSCSLPMWLSSEFVEIQLATAWAKEKVNELRNLCEWLTFLSCELSAMFSNLLASHWIVMSFFPNTLNATTALKHAPAKMWTYLYQPIKRYLEENHHAGTTKRAGHSHSTAHTLS